MRRGGRRLGELRRELAEHQVLAALLDQAERGGVPEDRRAAVAEHDLPAVGQSEQLGQPGAHGADEALHRRLAVRRADRPSAGGDERVDLLGADLRRARIRTARRLAAGRRGMRDRGRGSGRGHRDSMADDLHRSGSGCRRGTWEPERRVSQRLAAIAASATLAVDAKAKALKAQGENVIGFGAGEPDFPTPGPHRRGRRRGLPRAEEPPLHARRRPARAASEAIAAKTKRDSGFECTAGQVLVTNGGKHAVFTAFAVLCDPGRRGDLPGAVLDDLPGGDHARRRRAGGDRHRRRDRLPGHRRPARGGPHRAHQGAAVRQPRQPVRRRVPAGGGRGDRRVGGRARHLGDHRRDLRAPHLRPARVHLDARRSCPISPTSA